MGVGEEQLFTGPYRAAGSMVKNALGENVLIAWRSQAAAKIAEILTAASTPGRDPYEGLERGLRAIQGSIGVLSKVIEEILAVEQEQQKDSKARLEIEREILENAKKSYLLNELQFDESARWRERSDDLQREQLEQNERLLKLREAETEPWVNVKRKGEEACASNQTAKPSSIPVTGTAQATPSSAEQKTPFTRYPSFPFQSAKAVTQDDFHDAITHPRLSLQCPNCKRSLFPPIYLTPMPPKFQLDSPRLFLCEPCQFQWEISGREIEPGEFKQKMEAAVELAAGARSSQNHSDRT